ncbi:MAG: SPOR domain-containing protein [Candidatus Binatia bacterium]
MQLASPRSSGKLKVEVKREATAEKSRPEEKPAIEEDKHLSEAFKGTNDDVASSDTWSVQVAAFRDKSDAERLVDRLEEKGYETHIVAGERWHRVVVGEFVGVKEAGRVKDALVQEQRFSDAFLRHRAAQPGQ